MTSAELHCLLLCNNASTKQVFGAGLSMETAQQTMTTLIQFGTQALQGWFDALGRNGSRPEAGSNTELLDPLAQGLAMAQNVWLKGVRVSVGSLHQAIGILNSLGNFNQSTWHQLYDTTVGPLTRMPLLGPGRELNQTLLQVFDAWVQLYPAGVAYQGVLADFHKQSLEAFLDELIALTSRGEPLTDWMQMQQIWSQTADRIFEQAMGSNEALCARGQFLNAMNRYKLRQQEVIELYLNAMNLPTRGEVDDIHHTLYELRKEVKRLKKALPGDVS